MAGAGINVGDCVVCVDDAPRPDWAAYFGDPDYTRDLKVGRYYTVIDVVFEADFTGLILVEAPHPYPPEVGWDSDRFRKIDAADEQFTRSIRKRTPVDA